MARSIRRNIKIGNFCVNPIDRIGDNTELRIEEAKHGGKIILPPSVLRRVARNEQTLMIFKIINEKLNKKVFCGVFTFDGEEKKVLVPLWILKQLQIERGENVSVEYVTNPLVKGTFAKFEPLSNKFLDITDAKTVLEHCMQMYVCISRLDVISIYYNRCQYELRIVETLPADTIAIVDCDLEVDFAQMKQEKQEIDLSEHLDLDKLETENTHNLFEPFSGNGLRADGKKVIDSSKQTHDQKSIPDNKKRKLGVPDYDYIVGSLMFKRHKSDLKIVNKDQSKEQSKNPIERLQRRPVTRSQTAIFRSQQNSNQTKSANTMSQTKPAIGFQSGPDTRGLDTNKKTNTDTEASSSSQKQEINENSEE